MEGSRWGIKYNKNKREEERDRERERRKIKREFIEEGEGSNKWLFFARIGSFAWIYKIIFNEIIKRSKANFC